MSTKRLQLAALTRVSTEEQGRRGQSLLTKRKEIEHVVKYLGGEIVKWYSGQEHSTEGYERKVFDQLLKDARAGIFNAVIVTDLSRWSRDAKRSKEGFDILKKHSIRFFVGTMEYNMNLPEPNFVLGIMAEVSQFQAASSARKSILNRIERAKRGWPMGGRPPHGRRLKNGHADKSGYAEWEVDPEAQKEVLRLWRMYIEEDYSFEKMSRLSGIARNQLQALLLYGCGPEWKQTFQHKDIYEEITAAVPALLEDWQIEAVRNKAKANQRFRKSANPYPLAHYVRCAFCGVALTGATHHRRRYYIHRNDTRYPRMEARVKTVRGRELEVEVFAQIGKFLSSKENLELAIRDVLSKVDDRKEALRSRVEELSQRLATLERQRNNLIQSVMKGIFKESEVRQHVAEVRQQIEEVNAELEARQHELLLVETEIPENLAERVHRLVFAITGTNGMMPMNWSEEQQMRLAKFFFGTRNKELGVFITTGHSSTFGRYHQYEIRGVLGYGEGFLNRYPELIDRQHETAFTHGIDPVDFAELINGINNDLLPWKNSVHVSTMSWLLEWQHVDILPFRLRGKVIYAPSYLRASKN